MIISLLVVGAFTPPSVRAGAQAFLDLFRVVHFAPISVRADQMKKFSPGANMDLPKLLGDQVEVLKEPGPPKQVATIQEATTAAGVRVRQPAWLPAGFEQSRIDVMDEACRARHAEQRNAEPTGRCVRDRRSTHTRQHQRPISDAARVPNRAYRIHEEWRQSEETFAHAGPQPGSSDADGARSRHGGGNRLAHARHGECRSASLRAERGLAVYTDRADLRWKQPRSGRSTCEAIKACSSNRPVTTRRGAAQMASVNRRDLPCDTSSGRQTILCSRSRATCPPRNCSRSRKTCSEQRAG